MANLNSLPDSEQGARHGISIAGTWPTTSKTLTGKLRLVRWSETTGIGVENTSPFGAEFVRQEVSMQSMTLVGALPSTKVCATLTSAGLVTVTVR